MATNTQALQSVLVIVAALGWNSYANAATPILSVSNVVTDSLNLGTNGTVTTSGPSVYTGNNNATQNYQSNTVSTTAPEVQIAATETTAGLAYNYQTQVTTTSWNDVTWKNDILGINVNSTGTNQAGGKWISLTGSVLSAIDTSLYFSLSASGNFTPTATPFGAAAPLLASFYFGNAVANAVPGTYTNANLSSLSYNAQTYNSSYNSTNFNLSAGVAQSFVAYVFAATDVSINAFNLNASTGDYGLLSTPHSTTNITRTLLGASVLAPVPEPEQLAMLLAGMGMVGAMARRRRVAVY